MSEGVSHDDFLIHGLSVDLLALVPDRLPERRHSLLLHVETPIDQSKIDTVV